MLDKYTKILSDSPADKSFKTAFGEIRNLSELRNILVEKGKPFYDAFVNDLENHFANWVEGVFEDSELAQMLKNEKGYGAAIKLLDARINYAKLWLSFNEKKERLNTYLTNGSDLHEINQQTYAPSFHKFETLASMSLEGIDSIPSITKVINPPKATFLPQINLYPEKRDSKEEIFHNGDNISKEIHHKNNPEVELLKQLENQFPGIKIAEPPRKKSLFEKMFSFMYQ